MLHALAGRDFYFESAQADFEWTGVTDGLRLVATFGSLIANTDRHFGNLTFFDNYEGKFRLAPVYAMLPMLFAPEHDQLGAGNFDPPDPSTATLRAYGRARACGAVLARLRRGQAHQR